jgi:oligoribonuclease (3'-5' exoribonuclease)
MTERIPYLSIDIETTGLNPLIDKTTEIAIVIEDWKTNIEDLPYIAIGNRIDPVPHTTILHMIEFLKTHSHLLPPRPNLAGKNFGAFDLQFIKRLPNASDFLSMLQYRFIDVGSIYWTPTAQVPSLQDCLGKAGIQTTVEHKAYEDAIDVIKLIRYHFQ